MPIAHKHIKYVQQPAKQSAPHNVFVRNTQTLLNRWTGHAYYAILFAFFSICLFFSFNRYSVLLCLQILCAFFSLFFMNHCIFFFGRVMCVYLWNSSNIFYMYVNEYMRFFFASFSSNILPCLVILYTMILLCFFLRIFATDNYCSCCIYWVLQTRHGVFQRFVSNKLIVLV